MKPLTLAAVLVMAALAPAAAQPPPGTLDPTAWGNAPGPSGYYLTPQAPSSYAPTAPPYAPDPPFGGATFFRTQTRNCFSMPNVPGHPEFGFFVSC
jgi:hypothetical protein